LLQEKSSNILARGSEKKYGHPQSILTDNGSLFSSVRGGTSTFSHLCQTESIKLIKFRVFEVEHGEKYNA